MKRKLFRSITVLTLMLAGLVLAGCSSGDSHDHGSGDQSTSEHQHSH